MTTSTSSCTDQTAVKSRRQRGLAWPIVAKLGGLMAAAIFMLWSVVDAVAVAFFGLTADDLRYNLASCAIGWVVASLLYAATNWYRLHRSQHHAAQR